MYGFSLSKYDYEKLCYKLYDRQINPSVSSVYKLQFSQITACKISIKFWPYYFAFLIMMISKYHFIYYRLWKARFSIYDDEWFRWCVSLTYLVSYLTINLYLKIFTEFVISVFLGCWLLYLTFSWRSIDAISTDIFVFVVQKNAIFWSCWQK